MTEWNDLDPDDDGAQFFRRGVVGRVRRALHRNSCRPLGWARFRHMCRTVLTPTSNAAPSVRRSATP